VLSINGRFRCCIPSPNRIFVTDCMRLRLFTCHVYGGDRAEDRRTMNVGLENVRVVRKLATENIALKGLNLLPRNVPTKFHPFKLPTNAIGDLTSRPPVHVVADKLLQQRSRGSRASNPAGLRLLLRLPFLPDRLERFTSRVGDSRPPFDSPLVLLRDSAMWLKVGVRSPRTAAIDFCNSGLGSDLHGIHSSDTNHLTLPICQRIRCIRPRYVQH
jgi:hypothetical protein